METKNCHKCKLNKPLIDFWFHKKSKDGYNWNCKVCEAQNKKERVEKKQDIKKLEDQQKKVCVECKEAKSFEAFYKEEKGKYGLKSKCKDCLHKYKQKVRERGQKKVEDNKLQVVKDEKKVTETIITKKDTTEKVNTPKVPHNKITFEKLKSIVEDKHCKLNLTSEQFKEHNISNKSKIDVISKCGHDSNVQVSNFIHHNTGVVCKECQYKQSRQQGPNDYHIQERDAIKRIQELCLDKFIFHKCVEGSLVDFCIKPIDSQEDKWIPFQMKTTKSISHRIYTFKLRRSYKDIYILAFAIEDEKLWIINSNELEVQTNLSIGVHNSVYKKYEVVKENLSNHLIEMYQQTKFSNTLNTFDTPICEYSKREQDFFKHREIFFHELEYEYPDTDNRPYDLIINSKYRIQDKVVGKSTKTRKTNKDERKENYYYVCLSRQSGKSSQRPYKLGDNNFYWFHLQDTLGSYIIPEHVLFEHELINNDDTDFKVSAHIILYPYARSNMKTDNKTLWMNDYLYFYDNPEHIEKIYRMFN